MNGELMRTEIRQQPDVLQRILSERRVDIDRAAAYIRSYGPRFVLFVARGTSDHAALYAKYLVETRLGLPAGLASPSTTTAYNASVHMDGVLLIAVSQSGGSPDLLGPLRAARAAGALTLAVTNAANSPLAQGAELLLDVAAGPERAVAATKTYTAELLTLALLIDALSGRESEGAGAIPRRVRDMLALEETIADLTVRYRFAEQLIVTSRGYNYATALETALKLMETTYIVAHGFSGVDLLHGPMAMIDRGFPVIAIAPPGLGGEALRPVLQRLHELEADTFVVGDPGGLDPATIALPLTDMGPEYLSPIVAIVPLQLFALHLAVVRGVDPDRPRGLRKVTETW